VDLQSGLKARRENEAGPSTQKPTVDARGDKQLLALVAAKMDTASIARKLQRTESAIDTRKSKLKAKK
jgi:hypothetical protein